MMQINITTILRWYCNSDGDDDNDDDGKDDGGDDDDGDDEVDGECLINLSRRLSHCAQLCICLKYDDRNPEQYDLWWWWWWCCWWWW